ncbi:hypothetical protein [Streptomyces sp. NRRL S-813]|uniref:hypothetical protein n=1 Tax=Streptomyces sp. NRRL S-813 TaxID=1463919 RepID=UPI0004C03588|nr:hypothetical protein [Streptomyces sp. NRRL S-813]
MRARGRAGARRPKLTEDEATLAKRLYDDREETVQQTADMFGVLPVDGLRHLDTTKIVLKWLICNRRTPARGLTVPLRSLPCATLPALYNLC